MEAPQEPLVQGHDMQGLSLQEATERLAKHGRNKLPEQRIPNIALRIMDALKGDYLMLILIGVAIISSFLGDYVGAGIIAILVCANIGIGQWQEGKARNQTEALKQFTSQIAHVIRDGNAIDIDVEELVPGDLLILREGNTIPGDATILRAEELYVDESILTGESVSVQKESGSDIYSGTTITSGVGHAHVHATGLQTELGKIAGQLAEDEQPDSPLSIEMNDLAEKLAQIILSLCVVVVAKLLYDGGIPLLINGLMSGGLALVVFGIVFNVHRYAKKGSLLIGLGITLYSLYLMHTGAHDFGLFKEVFVFAVALAVGVIPEALVTIIALALQSGALRMARAQVIIKQLLATETLGCVSVVLSDKTGTLTVNQMTVKKIYDSSSDQVYGVTGEGYTPSGKIEHGDGPVLNLEEMIKCGVACNTSELMHDEHNRSYISGDPTEGALIVLAQKYGYEASADDSHVKLFPFSSERKMMSVVIGGDKRTVYTKGAFEMLSDRATHIVTQDGVVAYDEGWQQRLTEISDAMQSEAHRVIALACKDVEEIPSSMEDAESGLTLLGLVGIIDPPRSDVRESVIQAQAAGSRVVMVTGDAPKIAEVISQELNILRSGYEHRVITGDELGDLSDEALSKILLDEKTDVIFARTRPDQKARIAKVFQDWLDEIVAVTGDGVNDALALNTAHLGIAMGSGTDVAKGVGQVILTDDSLASIVRGIEGGRKIYKNVTKTVYFLMSTCFAEMVAILFALFAGIPIFFNAILILIINVGTETPPAFGLGIDSVKEDVMRDKPRPLSQKLMNRSFLWKNIWLGSVAAVCIILTYYWVTQDPFKLMNAAFFVFVAQRVVFSFTMRSDKFMLLHKFWDSKLIVLAAVFSVGVLWVTSFSPITQFILHVPEGTPAETYMLNTTDVVKCLILAGAGVVFEELRKIANMFLMRRQSHA